MTYVVGVRSSLPTITMKNVIKYVNNCHKIGISSPIKDIRKQQNADIFERL